MSNLDLETLAADAKETKPAASKITLDEVRALAEQQKLLEQELIDLEARVEAKKKELKDVCEYKLPNMLTEIGLKDLTLSTGEIIEMQDNIFASINETNKEEAHKWLREHNFQDLIKNVVSVTFGKGEDKFAESLVANIEAMGAKGDLSYGTLDQKEQVHNSTLRAFVKQRLQDGLELPLATFGVFEGKITKIRKPKIKG